MTTFAEWFEATRAKALETADGKEFSAAGFYLFANGGNCTAWRRDIGAGRYILVTDSEGASHDLGESHVDDDTKPDCYLVAWHDDEGNFGEPDEGGLAETAQAAIDAAARIAESAQ